MQNLHEVGCTLTDLLTKNRTRGLPVNSFPICIGHCRA